MRNVIVLAFALLALPWKLLAQPTVGVTVHTAESYDNGYVLFESMGSDTTYLIDKCGREVHKWWSNYTPGATVYLQPDGNLFKAGDYPNTWFHAPPGGSAGGIIQKLDWNSNVLWSYVISDSLEVQDHDFHPMPNGNVTAVVWEAISDSEARANGRDSALLSTTLWSAKLIELQPIGTDSAQIVWQWRLWDHIIQDRDSTKPHYGVVADHPELVNVNYVNPLISSGSIKEWIHMNSVDYNPELNQVIVSARNLDEIWIIDHSTTLAESGGHSGGVHNRGGDLLYRWGNPRAYNRGTSTDTRLWQQHNATWIPQGYRRAGQLMVFNNGYARPGGNATSIDIIAPPVDTLGNYALGTGAPYAPSASTWSYMAALPTSFYSEYMGSTQILPNGNMLICNATSGVFFEIDSNRNTVWQYVTPLNNGTPVSQGTNPMGLSDYIFKCVFYPATYPGLSGQVLSPQNTIELNPIAGVCELGLASASAASVNVVYPNPAGDVIRISGGAISVVQLIDMMGRTITHGNFSNQQTVELNTSPVPNGVYILKINDAEYHSVEIMH
jgi:hypothetical protein